jgi:hypothetical protein
MVRFRLVFVFVHIQTYILVKASSASKILFKIPTLHSTRNTIKKRIASATHEIGVLFSSIRFGSVLINIRLEA